MADVDMTGKHIAIVESTNGADRTVQVEEQYAYRCIHVGVDTSNASSTATIIFTVSETPDTVAVTASMAAATNKFPLQSGAFAYFGPGLKLLTHEAIAGSPVFAIERSPHHRGNF